MQHLSSGAKKICEKLRQNNKTTGKTFLLHSGSEFGVVYVLLLYNVLLQYYKPYYILSVSQRTEIHQIV